MKKTAENNSNYTQNQIKYFNEEYEIVTKETNITEYQKYGLNYKGSDIERKPEEAISYQYEKASMIYGLSEKSEKINYDFTEGNTIWFKTIEELFEYVNKEFKLRFTDVIETNRLHKGIKEYVYRDLSTPEKQEKRLIINHMKGKISLFNAITGTQYSLYDAKQAVTELAEIDSDVKYSIERLLKNPTQKQINSFEEKYTIELREENVVSYSTCEIEPPTAEQNAYLEPNNYEDDYENVVKSYAIVPKEQGEQPINYKYSEPDQILAYIYDNF